MGIPTVTFVLDAFERAAREHTRIHGEPNMPIIIVPRDFLEEPSDDAVVARDHSVFAAVIDAISS
jgi:hypothetical protein